MLQSIDRYKNSLFAQSERNLQHRSSTCEQGGGDDLLSDSQKSSRSCVSKK